jgi:hypothetical protein
MEDFNSNYKSFVYQRPQDFSPNITAKCIVHFRPHKEWDGTEYGFDWMRLGDTNVFGDQQPYNKIVGNQYHNASTIGKSKGITAKDLVEDTNEYRGNFKSDYSMYQKLEGEYNKLLMLAIPIRPPLAIPQYYCPWLSLFPKNIVKSNKTSPSGYKNTKATLRLYIDVMEEPDYLEFEENKFFTITPMKITEDLGIGKPRFWKRGVTVTIECNEQIRVEQGIINIFAYKKDKVNDCMEKKLAGRLHVWENVPYRRVTAKILLVNVKTPPFGKGDYNKMGRNTVGKHLLQALVDTKIEEYKPGDFLDLSGDSQFKKFYVKGKSLNIVPSSKKTLDQYLYKKLQEELVSNGKTDHEYSDYYRVFYVGGRSNDNTAAYSYGDNVVVFNILGQPEENINHELLHCFNLDHTFSNRIIKNNESPNALYTYKVFETENMMDYSHVKGNKCFMTWQWQWLIANRSVK